MAYQPIVFAVFYHKITYTFEIPSVKVWANLCTLDYDTLFVPVIQQLCVCACFSDVQHMAIDWLTRNLYFVDHVSDRIFVCNYNGSVCVTLIDLELHNPKAIAVDPTAG